ncbi:MAG: hypothetical protein M1837_006932 [Sclerophora amabilis]|nr:MAG: hypothetical protein M1837_006932 [Sclerophora amabilis]
MQHRRPPSPSHSGTRHRASSPTKVTEKQKPNINSLNYRDDVLYQNGIIIRGNSELIPQTILDEAQRTLQEPTSSSITYGDALQLCKSIETFQTSSEASLGQFYGLKIFPLLEDRVAHTGLKQNQQLPLDNYVIPYRAPLVGARTEYHAAVPCPIPDLLYGFEHDCFDSEERLTQECNLDGVDLTRISHPSRDLYWPFFVVEFKSQVSRGNVWRATNQCAGGGSACVKALEALLEISSPWLPGREENHDGRVDGTSSRSLVYSVAVDDQLAVLNVHWFDVLKQEFHLQRIATYILTDPTDVQQFCTRVKGILEWGLATRLPQIKEALRTIYEERILSSHVR